MTRTTCDACSHDVGHGPNSFLRITLTSDVNGGCVGPHRWVAPALVEPLLSRAYHFCNFRCLAEWAARMTTGAEA